MHTGQIQIFPEVIHVPAWVLRLEYLMQKYWLPELPLCGGYKNNETSKNLFSTHAFACPVSKHTALNTAKSNLRIKARQTVCPHSI